jgi:hypothetical protein
MGMRSVAVFLVCLLAALGSKGANALHIHK